MNWIGAIVGLSCLALAVGPAMAKSDGGGNGKTQPSSTTQSQNPTGTQSPLAINPAYVLGPEDVITVVTQNVPEMSGDFLVAPNGHIMFPIVGDVVVAGHTLSELQKILVDGLTTQLRDPQVSVNLKQMRQNRIYILGSVRQPNVYDYKPGWHLSQLIAAAGGITDPANRLTAVLFRNGQDPQKISLSDLLINVNPDADIALKTGDTVYIQPKETIQVNVVGQVTRSGLVQIDANQGAVEALGAAQGPTQQAALSKAIIRRGTQTIPVDLYDAVVKGDGNKDVQMFSGDTLVIPQVVAQVSVVGTVSHPGPLVMPDGRTMTLSQAISEAGGLASRAKNSCTLTTIGKDGKLITKDYNLKTLGSKGEPDPVLKDRDVVFIPQSGAPNINDALGISQLYYVLRAIIF